MTENTIFPFTLYAADVCGGAENCVYPRPFTVRDAAGLERAVCRDYVCAEYEGHRRSVRGFVASDCLAMDCDNDHSENPADWVGPEDVAQAFPEVAFAVHYSRSHMREKGGRAARPKFHVLFPIARVTDAGQYAGMKRQVQRMFPYFDAQALDAARFFFGTVQPEVAIFPGTRTLSAFLAKAQPTQPQLTLVASAEERTIPQGQRNATLSRFAAKVLKRYGDGPQARQAFRERAACCEPPLAETELAQIWRSALGFYGRVSAQPDYVPPAIYNAEDGALALELAPEPEVQALCYKPQDYTNVGEAEVLARVFGDQLRYSPATHYLRYSDHYWQETETGAQACVHALTRRQLAEAEQALAAAEAACAASGAQTMLTNMTKEKAEKLMNPQQRQSWLAWQDAKRYRSFVLKCRDSAGVSATMREARPMLEIAPRQLDADPFLLCTPLATYDLRQGLAGARAHDAADYITKITAVSPSDEGAALWQDFLNQIFCDDAALIDYVQRICGLIAIGKVFVEALIIAYGDGANGKSTFWNAISRVLGLYSGNLSADALTAGCRRGIKQELAELKGKRLVIAAEMPEGARLGDATVKQLCSTDDIFAEKKYKDPFAFAPSHTLVLYTNHLPRVGASDDGTWRRLIVIPFRAKISATGDVKNYADTLVAQAGGSILAWIIEGARLIISEHFQLTVPDSVTVANDHYRRQNDWFGHFLAECCDLGEGFRESSSALYKAYCSYCAASNEYTRNKTDFYATLEKAGFTRVIDKRKRYIEGLRLRSFENDASYGRTE